MAIWQLPLYHEIYSDLIVHLFRLLFPADCVEVCPFLLVGNSSWLMIRLKPNYYENKVNAPFAKPGVLQSGTRNLTNQLPKLPILACILVPSQMELILILECLNHRLLELTCIIYELQKGHSVVMVKSIADKMRKMHLITYIRMHENDTYPVDNTLNTKHSIF